MKIILLGAPGAGKGTQAEKICDYLSVPAISTGNIIREALRSGSKLGEEAKAYIDKGQLVPDEVVIGIIKERLNDEDCKNGYILDGFPRTIPQAEALDEMGIEIDKVIDLEVPEEDIIQRMSGRRVCEKCGASYHLVNKKPLKDGVCDKCAGTLVQRKDDHPDTVKERLRVYNDQTAPLKSFYEEKGKLFVIKNIKDIDGTTKSIINALEA